MNPAGFNPNMAIACASAAAGSYGSETLSTELAHVWRSAPGYLAFRGSASLRDWLTNFHIRRDRFEKTELGFCSVHAGFYAAIKSVIDQIQGPMSIPLVIAGHSLGGALAMLCAYLLWKRGYTVAAVYTFGGPRVGDWRFAHAYNQALGDVTYRLVYKEDIVPRLPPALLGYCHAGTEVFFPSLGRMRFGAPLWFKLASDIWGTWRSFQQGRISQFADHPISEYAALVETLRPARTITP